MATPTLYLNDALHEVFLRNGITTLDHLLQHTGEYFSLVHAGIDGLKLGETDKVRPHKNSKLQPFLFSPLLLPGVALVLHSNPQLVHLGKVVKNECNGVLY